MNTQDALAIIAAHGADARRWPADDRAALLALASGDAEVAAAIAEARQLDALLGGWATAAAPGAVDLAAITRLPQERPARRGWFAGGALAAAVAAGFAVFAALPDSTPLQIVSNDTTVMSATADGDGLGSDAEVFAAVFTPTVDEDELI